MMLLRSIVCLAVVLSVSVSGFAQEKQKKGKAAQAPPSATARLVEKLELTDAQKESVAAIDKQFAPKLQELNKKRSAILTADQRKAQQAAQKAGREAGSTPAEIRKAVEAALQLTPEQSAQMKEVQKLQTALNGQVLEALKKVLTPEQQAKLPNQGAGKKKGNAAKAKGKQNAAE